MSKRKEKKELDDNTYVGIVDTMGLDSFTKMDSHSAMCMKIRADANPQRHACLFLAVFEEGEDPEADIRALKDPWKMWGHIQGTAKEIRCEPKHAKTIANIRKLAKTMVECTGNAWGY